MLFQVTLPFAECPAETCGDGYDPSAFPLCVAGAITSSECVPGTYGAHALAGSRRA